MSRITEIRYVGYAVPDLEAERAFYRDVWGLVDAGEKDGMAHFATCAHQEAYVVRLRGAEQKRIDVIALAAGTRADVDALHGKVAAAGCRIIFAPKQLDTLGGDYGFPYNPIGRNARDLGLFVDLFGFSPVEALVAGTRQGGELMDLPVGEIRAGKLADILLVDGDPTSDVAILEDRSRLLAIMKGGRFHKPPRSPHEPHH